jgi:hypothetical protein
MNSNVMVAETMAETSTSIALNPDADQTATSSPLKTWSENYTVSLKRLKGRSAAFPTLQSFSVGQTKAGAWLMFGGRTNGRHTFTETDDGTENFPPAYQNTEAWVYNPKTDRSWSRPWSESGLSEDIQLSLSTTNGEFLQQSDTLFYVGGYVYDSTTKSFETRNRLTALALGDVAAWVKGKTKRLPKHAALSIEGKSIEVSGNSTGFFAVTGGEMLWGEKDNQAQLIFGHDFQGGYGNPALNTQTYTSQVRNFQLKYNRDKGKLGYSVNSISTPDNASFMRRDLNVVNQLSKNNQGELKRNGTALAGVFYNGNGAWTVPAKIDLLTGQPTMANPSGSSTFRQGVNAYSAANLGLYSRSEDSQTNLIFGGISAITLDPSGDPFYNTVNPYPFTSQIAALKHNSKGRWKQSLLGSFPTIANGDGDPLTFGANAAFIPLQKGLDKRVHYLADGVLNLDRLKRLTNPGASVLVGYVAGGIANVVANNFTDPSTYGDTLSTRASGEIFKVVVTMA